MRRKTLIFCRHGDNRPSTVALNDVGKSQIDQLAVALKRYATGSPCRAFTSTASWTAESADRLSASLKLRAPEPHPYMYFDMFDAQQAEDAAQLIRRTFEDGADTIIIMTHRCETMIIEVLSHFWGLMWKLHPEEGPRFNAHLQYATAVAFTIDLDDESVREVVQI